MMEVHCNFVLSVMQDELSSLCIRVFLKRNVSFNTSSPHYSCSSPTNNSMQFSADFIETASYIKQMDESPSKPEQRRDQPSSSDNGPVANSAVAPKKRRGYTTSWGGVTSEDIRLSDWAKKVPSTRSLQRIKDPALKEAWKGLQSAESERSSAQKTLESVRKAFEEAKRNLVLAEAHAEDVEERFHQARSTVEELDIQKPNNKWNEMFSKLEDFKKQHGHIRVGEGAYASDPEFARLRKFVQNARTAYKEYESGKRTTNKPHRMVALERLGVFVGRWEERYNELIEYKNTHGHCNVPTKSKENKKLGYWVGLQRSEYKKYKDGKHHQMPQERLKLLTDIGFCFNLYEERGIVRKRTY